MTKPDRIAASAWCSCWVPGVAKTKRHRTWTPKTGRPQSAIQCWRFARRQSGVGVRRRLRQRRGVIPHHKFLPSMTVTGAAAASKSSNRRA